MRAAAVFVSSGFLDVQKSWKGDQTRWRVDPPRMLKATKDDRERLGVSTKKGTPKWMVYNFIMENPIKMDEFGSHPYFWKHPFATIACWDGVEHPLCKHEKKLSPGYYGMHLQVIGMVRHVRIATSSTPLRTPWKCLTR